jgi:pyruvate carboxylase
VDFEEKRKELAGKIHHEPRDLDVLSYVLYPQVFLDFA